MGKTVNKLFRTLQRCPNPKCRGDNLFANYKGRPWLAKCSDCHGEFTGRWINSEITNEIEVKDDNANVNS